MNVPIHAYHADRRFDSYSPRNRPGSVLPRQLSCYFHVYVGLNPDFGLKANQTPKPNRAAKTAPPALRRKTTAAGRGKRGTGGRFTAMGRACAAPQVYHPGAHWGAPRGPWGHLGPPRSPCEGPGGPRWDLGLWELVVPNACPPLPPPCHCTSMRGLPCPSHVTVPRCLPSPAPPMSPYLDGCPGNGEYEKQIWAPEKQI